MIQELSGEPLGPAGVASRMSQIEAKLNAFSGDIGQNGGIASFSATMANQIANANGGPSPLPGTIGMSGAIGANGEKPLSPFGDGVSVGSSAPAQIQSLIQQAAAKHGVDPDLLDALVQQESGYSPTSRSPVGAMGLTQLMPHTAESLGVSNPFDPAQNLDGGAKYLKQQLDRFGDVRTALAAFNAGPGAVVKYGGIPPFKETQAYVRNIVRSVERSKAIQHG